ncbi:MAG: terminase small subunit [Flavipsychrobacter sp.]|nr:terminase small subunit [Flavipsychrobacter sp.]
MKPQHEIFVREMIRHGNRSLAYKAAYPDAKDEALRTAAARLLAKPHIQQAIDAVMQPLREKAIAELEQQATERVKEEICSLQQRREVLAKIILGRMQVKKHIRLKDTIHEVYDDVSPAAVIRAIDLDSKLAANKYKEKISTPAPPEVKTPVVIQQPVGDCRQEITHTAPEPPLLTDEERYQRDVEAFFKMFPHLPADYLTNPKYREGVYIDELPPELRMEDENSVTVCNQSVQVANPADEATDKRWKTYQSLEPQLAYLPPELVKIREANFRSMKPSAQRSLISPLLMHLTEAKAASQRLRNAS